MDTIQNLSTAWLERQQTKRQQMRTDGPAISRPAVQAAPVCDECKGKEWVTYDVPPSHPLFSKTVRCPKCGPAKRHARLLKLCRLSPEMLEWTYENTQATTRNGDAYDYGQQIARKPQWFYTLYGPFGTGKTRLLACLVNAGRLNGYTSIYLTMAELLDYLRSTFNAKTQEQLSFDGLWESVCESDILAIDECDRWNPTPWAQEKFFELIEQRYRDGETRCTAFATNANIDELDGYLASRMHDRRGRVFNLNGGDWRR